MSRAAVVQFCHHVAQAPELQNRLENAVKSGAGWDSIVSVGHELGFEFTTHEAAECFEYERQRRATRESPSHSETTILKQSPIQDARMAETFILRGREAVGRSACETDDLSLKSLRRIALSRDWSMELPLSAKGEDESVLS